MQWYRWRWPLWTRNWRGYRPIHVWPHEPYLPLLVQPLNRVQVVVRCSGRQVPATIEDGQLYVAGGGRSVHGPYAMDDPRFLILPSEQTDA